MLSTYHSFGRTGIVLSILSSFSRSFEKSLRLDIWLMNDISLLRAREISEHLDESHGQEKDVIFPEDRERRKKKINSIGQEVVMVSISGTGRFC
jgi:hypothetical protein